MRINEEILITVGLACRLMLVEWYIVEFMWGTFH
jgi:hypothetical protein